MSRRRVASIGSGVTFVMAGAAGAAGGQLAGSVWAWVCLLATLSVGGLVTGWTMWRTTDSDLTPDATTPQTVRVGAGAIFSGRDMTIHGGVSTSTGSDAPVEPSSAAGPGWQVGPGVIAAARDMQISGDAQTRTGGSPES